MKRVEMVVDRETIGDLRDGLRDLGIRTLRVGEVDKTQEPFIHGINGQAVGFDSPGHPRA